MARVLITGSGGFVGHYLVRKMADDGHDIVGVDRRDHGNGFAGVDHRVVDLMDESAVTNLIADVKPECIMHLAAQSSVRHSFDAPYKTLLSNTLPTLNILNAVAPMGADGDGGPGPRILVIGSADEYGPVADPSLLPLTEMSPRNPVSPYALSKSVQNQYCVGYAGLYGVDVVMTRSFNHTGAGQTDTFVLPSFARQVAEIHLGFREPVIHVGDLSVKRDFLDVRDVCDAYALLFEKGRKGETYNVCSGTAYEVKSLLERMCELAGVEVDIRVDPARLRPAETPELRGDATKLHSDTGWKPRYTMDDTLNSLLEYWKKTAKDHAADSN